MKGWGWGGTGSGTLCSLQSHTQGWESAPSFASVSASTTYVKGSRKLGVGILRCRLDAGKVPQSVMCLPSKHNILRSMPRTPIKLPGVVA